MPEWGSTVRDLELAYQTFLDSTCPACERPIEVCHDEEAQDRWQPRISTCYATRAVEDFREAHRDDIGPAAIISAHLLPAGEEAHDPLAYDPARAAAEFAAQEARYGPGS